MFSIVLVCLENFQEYILTNIAQLLKLGHTELYIITNEHLMHEFEPFTQFCTEDVKSATHSPLITAHEGGVSNEKRCNNVLKLISAEKLNDPFDFKGKSSLDKEFRGGFWHHTSARFFAIHSFMLKYGVQNVIHIENDVLLYYDCNKTLLETLIGSNQLHIPFDTYERNIASIVYIPNHEIFGQILEHYDFGKNDMYNFSEIRKKTGLINNLPIFVSQTTNAEKAFVTNGYKKYIFDAAAIGQFIGGVDPRNAGGDTRGFVNETCVIKYNDEGEIFWKMIDGFNKPFIRVNRVEVPIFNLHIHCKNLALYC